MSMSSSINRKPRILLGVTGSVAAVKGPMLALRLANEVKADVKVVLTRTVERYFWKEGRAVATYDGESWRELLAATSETPSEGNGGDEFCITSKGAISIHYAEEEWSDYKSLRDSVLHIDLRNWADICLVAPLSAHTLAKIANGLCDDLLTCCIRAWDFGQRESLGDDNDRRGKPVIFAPAMNTTMWDHPLTRKQLDTIRQFSFAEKTLGDNDDCKGGNGGVIVVEPTVKTLACGEVGAGALAELDDIICAVKRSFMGCKNRCIESSYDTAKDSSCRRASMKRALLLYAKRRFGEMKSCHEQRSTGQGSSSSQLAAPISPTPNLIIEAFLPLLNLTSDSLLIDLGCGDGRWLVAANKSTHCRCLGVDMDGERLKMAQESICNNGLQELVRVQRQDVFEFVKESDDINTADVIILYLFREAMVEMGALLQQRFLMDDQKNGFPPKSTQILSVGFALTGWASVHEEKIHGIRVYLYSTTTDKDL